MGEVGGVEELAGLLCCDVGSSSNGMPLDLPLKLPQVGIVLLRGWRRVGRLEETLFVQGWYAYCY